MQVVYILCDDLYVEMFFQFSESVVGCIGRCLQHIFAALIIEFEHEGRVLSPAAWSSYFGNIKAFPESVTVAESPESAFGADPRAGEHYHFLLSHDQS